MWQARQDGETRKVQLTGGSTYIISLPKNWITQNQVKKGSFIKLREAEGGLLTIFPPATKIEKRQDEAIIKVASKDEPEILTRKVVSAYLAGYNSIYIKSDKGLLSTKQRHDLKSFVRRMLVGTEIVTDTSAQLILQVLLSYPELTVQSALRRMSIITATMHKDAILGLIANDNTLTKEIILTDNEVDRFDLYVTRQLRTAILNPRITKEIGLINSRDCLGYRLVTKSVERTADHAVKIAQNALALKHELNENEKVKIENMSNIAINMFEKSMESLFRQEYLTAENILGSSKQIVDLEKDAILSSEKDSEDTATLRLIIESIRRTAEYACDIAQIVLNLTVDSILT